MVIYMHLQTRILMEPNSIIMIGEPVHTAPKERMVNAFI